MQHEKQMSWGLAASKITSSLDVVTSVVVM
jgi:hypothetical protein